MEMRTGTLVGAGAMAVAWGLVWAMPGGVIEAIDNIAPSAHGFTRQIDMWMQTLGMPGLIGGVIFSVLLVFTGGRRRVDELPLSASAAWGALAGLLTGAIVVWLLYTGLSNTWQSAAVAMGYATLMGAVSGAISPLLFRLAARRRASANAARSEV